jgi:GTP-binding protein
VIRARLMAEAETNVAIRVTETPGGEAFEVAGAASSRSASCSRTCAARASSSRWRDRGVLMREEGGERLEPIEEVTVDVDADYSGVVVDKLNQRRGELPRCARAPAARRGSSRWCRAAG